MRHRQHRLDSPGWRRIDISARSNGAMTGSGSGRRRSHFTMAGERYLATGPPNKPPAVDPGKFMTEPLRPRRAATSRKLLGSCAMPNVGGRLGSALLSEAGAHPRRYEPRGRRGKNEARRDDQRNPDRSVVGKCRHGHHSDEADAEDDPIGHHVDHGGNARPCRGFAIHDCLSIWGFRELNARRGTGVPGCGDLWRNFRIWTQCPPT